MSRLLTWREAKHSDRTLLQHFSCTVPAQRAFHQKRRSHPRPWELEVQSGIRALRPPVTADQSLLLGEDSEGIAAVILMAEQGDGVFFKIQAIAVATRHRGRGGACGDEAMAMIMETAAARGRKSGRDAIVMVGWVHPRNGAARRLNQRHGFRHHADTSGGLEEWVLALDLRNG